MHQSATHGMQSVERTSEGESRLAVRIYSLAKELKYDSKELVDLCAKAGITGKGSALASLADDEVVRLKEYLANRNRPAERPSSERPLERPDRTAGRAADSRIDSTKEASAEAGAVDPSFVACTGCPRGFTGQREPKHKPSTGVASGRRCQQWRDFVARSAAGPPRRLHRPRRKVGREATAPSGPRAGSRAAPPLT